MNRRTILTACITFVIGIMAGVLVMLNDNAYGAINQALNGSTSNAVGRATSNLNGPGNVLEIRNLPWAYTQEDLANAVSELHVEVLTARIAVDRETGRSLGYGFVEVTPDRRRQRPLLCRPPARRPGSTRRPDRPHPAGAVRGAGLQPAGGAADPEPERPQAADQLPAAASDMAAFPVAG